jgi:chorismate mutase
VTLAAEVKVLALLHERASHVNEVGEEKKRRERY